MHILKIHLLLVFAFTFSSNAFSQIDTTIVDKKNLLQIRTINSNSLIDELEIRDDKDTIVLEYYKEDFLINLHFDKQIEKGYVTLHQGYISKYVFRFVNPSVLHIYCSPDTMITFDNNKYASASPYTFSFIKDGISTSKTYTYNEDDSIRIELLYLEKGIEKLYTLTINLTKRREE